MITSFATEKVAAQDFWQAREVAYQRHFQSFSSKGTEATEAYLDSFSKVGNLFANFVIDFYPKYQAAKDYISS